MSNRDDRFRRDAGRAWRARRCPAASSSVAPARCWRARDRARRCSPRAVAAERQQQSAVGRRRQQVASRSRTGPSYMDATQSKSDFTEGHRDRAHLRRGHQRQQRVLRQDPPEPAARTRASARDGFVLTDWMANRMINQVKWVAAVRRGEVPEQGEPPRRARSHPASTRPASSARRGRAASPASRTTSRSTGGKEIKTIDEFLAVERHDDGALDEMRDTVGLFMRSLGIDTDEADLRRRASRRSTSSQKAFDDDTIDGINGNEYVNDLAQREPRRRVRVVGRRRADHEGQPERASSRSRTRAACSGRTTS